MPKKQGNTQESNRNEINGPSSAIQKIQKKQKFRLKLKAADASDASSFQSMQFGKKLAAIDKTTRDRGVKLLHLWLSKHQNLNEVDMLSIWKALHYCMWLADKPLIQHELAEKLSESVHIFSNGENALRWMKVFFQTINREWFQIDRHRVDKYYTFIRKFLEQCFRYLANLSWAVDAVTQFVTMMEQGTLSDAPASLNANPVHGVGAEKGVKLHLIDIYLDELYRVTQSRLDGPILTLLLRPFLRLSAESTDKVIVKRIKQLVFSPLTQQYLPPALREQETTQEGEDEQEPSYFNTDFAGLANEMLTYGSKQDILARNRKLLYSLSSALSKLAEQQSNIPKNNTNQNQANSVEATQENHEEKSQPTKRKKGNKQQNGSENGHTKHDTQPEETQDAKKRVRIDLDANIHQDYDVFKKTFGQSPGHQKDKSPTSGILKKKGHDDSASPLQLAKPRTKSKKEILKQKMKAKSQ